MAQLHQQQQEALADAALEDLHAAVFAARQVLQAMAGPGNENAAPSQAASAKEDKKPPPAAAGSKAAGAGAAAAAAGPGQRAGTGSAGSLPAAISEQWSAADAQQVYLARTTELRSKVQQLYGLRAAAAAAAGAVKQEPADLQAVAALEQRKQELISQVGAASEVEATLMAQLRGLLDSFALWEAHKKHLDTAPSTGLGGR